MINLCYILLQQSMTIFQLISHEQHGETVDQRTNNLSLSLTITNSTPFPPHLISPELSQHNEHKTTPALYTKSHYTDEKKKETHKSSRLQHIFYDFFVLTRGSPLISPFHIHNLHFALTTSRLWDRVITRSGSRPTSRSPLSAAGECSSRRRLEIEENQ
jgi:hypothetical protein